MTEKYIKRTQGFTLVELSIVIIIIGFLIAGIAAGQSLIKQAKLNHTVNEFKSIATSIYTFNSVYGYLPGDLPSATSFYPSSSTIDGNGDGFVRWNTFSGNDCPNNQEVLHAWEHLKLAGLINGNYSGICSNDGVALDSEYNSGLGGNAIIFFSYNPLSAWVNSLPSTPTNFLVLSNGGGIGLSDDSNPVLSPLDAKSIDNKMDDGLPLSGNLFANDGYGTPNTCHAAGVNEYTLEDNNIRCILGYNYGL